MESFYQQLSLLLDNTSYNKVLSLLIKYIPFILFIIYPLTLLYLLITQHPLFLETMIKPLGAFLFVSIIRKVINRKRPYEHFDIKPLYIHKHGESFPSRHTVSAFSISFALIHINPYLGIFGFIIASIIAITRVLGCLHYVSDVLAAILISLIVDLL